MHKVSTILESQMREQEKIYSDLAKKHHVTREEAIKILSQKYLAESLEKESTNHRNLQYKHKLPTLSYQDILQKREESPDIFLFGEWCAHPSLNMIYALPKVGKSFICLQMAIKLSLGVDLRTKLRKKQYKVLYIDAEMSMNDMARHLDALIYKDLPSDLSLEILNYDFLIKKNLHIPYLNEPGGIKSLQERILDEQFEVVFLDNLCALTPGRDPNDVPSWKDIDQFLLRLRCAGKTVFLVHHAGKSGQQLGITHHVMKMDNVVKLNPPKHSKNAGEVNFTVEASRCIAPDSGPVSLFQGSLNPSSHLI